MKALDYVLTGLAALSAVLQAGGNALSLIGQLRLTIGALVAENRDPSEAEWHALNAQIAAAIAALN